MGLALPVRTLQPFFAKGERSDEEGFAEEIARKRDEFRISFVGRLKLGRKRKEKVEGTNWPEIASENRSMFLSEGLRGLQTKIVGDLFGMALGFG